MLRCALRAAAGCLIQEMHMDVSQLSTNPYWWEAAPPEETAPTPVDVEPVEFVAGIAWLPLLRFQVMP